MRLEDTELDELLAPMRDGPVALSGAAEGASRRQRLLPGVRAAVAATPARRLRTRRLRRAGIGAAASCVLLAAALVLGRQRPSEPELAAAPAMVHVEALGSEAPIFVDAHGTAHALTGDAPLAGPGELRSPASSWSRVLTARGARIELAPRARLRITPGTPGTPGTSAKREEPEADLQLERGEAHCSVPKLGAHGRFSIATPDARVVVHGTVFSVKVGEAAAGSRTCVRVNEGLVEVQHRGGSSYLRPGMQWGCEAEPEVRAAAAATPASPPAAVSATTEEQEPALGARAARARASKLAARRTARSKLSGTLAQETALLASALSAERDGDQSRARSLFSELMIRHPRSPLAPEARAGAARTR